MSTDQALDHAVTAVVTAIDAVCGFRVDDLDLTLDELAETWLVLEAAAKELSVIVNDLAVNVGLKLSDMPYERKDGYRLPNGELIHHEQRALQRWAGRQLLLDLSTWYADTMSGETVQAIPTEVLLDIIPGVATDKLTSSNWRISGLQNVDVDVENYRTREWRQPRAAKGPGR